MSTLELSSSLCLFFRRPIFFQHSRRVCTTTRALPTASAAKTATTSTGSPFQPPSGQSLLRRPKAWALPWAQALTRSRQKWSEFDHLRRSRESRSTSRRCVSRRRRRRSRSRRPKTTTTTKTSTPSTSRTSRNRPRWPEPSPERLKH